MRGRMGVRAGVSVLTLSIAAASHAAPPIASRASGPHSHFTRVSSTPPVTTGPAFCASGIFLYAAVWSPPEIHIFCVGPSGTLDSRGFVSQDSDVRDLQVSADGKSLYYAHSDLTEYAIGTDGSLTLVGSSPVGSGAFFDLAVDPSDPSRRMLYATHSKDGGGLYVYDTQASSGVPALVQTVSGLYLPRGLAIDEAGGWLYAANGFPQEIHSFALLPNGRLDAGSLQLTSFEPRAHLFASRAAPPMLYWTESLGGSVMCGSVGSGALDLTDSVFSGFGATALTFDADGDNLYVVQNNTDDIAVYDVSPSGAMSFAQLVDTPRRPEHLVLHPQGSFLYVASAGDSTGTSEITLYSVDANGGLSNLGSEASLQQGLFRLAIAQP